MRCTIFRFTNLQNGFYIYVNFNFYNVHKCLPRLCAADNRTRFTCNHRYFCNVERGHNLTSWLDVNLFSIVYSRTLIIDWALFSNALYYWIWHCKRPSSFINIYGWKTCIPFERQRNTSYTIEIVRLNYNYCTLDL